MNVIELDLPFPLRGLSPNSRLHWRAKAAVTARYREMCGWAAREAMQQHGLKGALHSPVVAEVTFALPTRHRRDEDNLKASMKAAWDGLVDAGLLVDDDIARFKVVVLGAEYAGAGAAGGGRLIGAVKVTLKSNAETYSCCGIGPLDQIRVRYKRSNAAKALDGKLAVVVEHVVTTEEDDFPGKHMLQLLGDEVIWGDEAELVT